MGVLLPPRLRKSRWPGTNGSAPIAFWRAGSLFLYSQLWTLSLILMDPKSDPKTQDITFVPLSRKLPSERGDGTARSLSSGMGGGDAGVTVLTVAQGKPSHSKNVSQYNGR